MQSVRKFVRDGKAYTALYDTHGRLIRLFVDGHHEVPAESKTFRRLAADNRGGRFVEVPYEQYIVVLAYNANAGGYSGVRTWSAYDSKAEFDEWYRKEGTAEYDIVAAGVTERRAIQLCQQTPLRNYVRAAVAEATGPDGLVNTEIAQMKMFEVMLVRGGRLAPI